PFVRLVHELDEVARRAVAPVDAVVVADVVAVVAVRGRLERREPQRVDTQELQVVEASYQSFEVADAVAVRVHERLEIEAVDHRVLVPELVDHAGAPSSASSTTSPSSARSRNHSPAIAAPIRSRRVPSSTRP